jgi:predicted nuclease of predicted toxin-antitoxin system
LIIADENIDPRIIHALRAAGFDVMSVFETHRGIDDYAIIELSRNPPRIILTNDKDFGEWVFAHHESELAVILLRYDFYEWSLISQRLVGFLRLHSPTIWNKFVTFTLNNIRIRNI